MKQYFKSWWEGTYVPAPENDSNSRVFIIALGTYERSLSSKAAHVFVDFWLKHWQWTIGVFLVVFFGFWRK
jgi:DNA primase catalytic subunit